MITSVKIYGDFFGKKDVSDVEALLAGVKYAPAEIRQAMAKIDLTRYFAGIPTEEIIELLAVQK